MKKSMSLNKLKIKCLKSFLIYKNKRTSKRFVIGTPIVVLDVNSNKSFEFISISETARYFNTYPKTI